MRTSKRQQILDAAERVVERDGVEGLTYESLAEEAAVTKGGLHYHFSSREELLLAVHRHLAERWEASMGAAAGKPWEDCTASERHAAFATVNVKGASRAELLMIFGGTATPAHAGVWGAVFDRWQPPTPAPDSSAADIDLFIARLAGDGLWIYEKLTGEVLDPTLRKAVASRLADTVAHRETRS